MAIAQSPKPFAITPVYDLLLRGSPRMPIGLCHLQVATAAQLCRLHYEPGCLKKVKDRLKDLGKHGYVQPDATPTQFFRSPYYYVLAREGLRYLRLLGEDVSDAARGDKEADRHALFITHTLELNDVLITAALLGRETSDCYLDSFIHEHILKRSPYQARWRGGTCALIPDAFLDLRVNLPTGRQRLVRVLLEHDRGTEQRRYFRRRIRAYIVLLKSEAYKQRFHTNSVTIAFTTTAGERRLAQMREWTYRELSLTGEPASLGNTFCFTSLQLPIKPRELWLEPCWFTPYDGPPTSLLLGE